MTLATSTSIESHSFEARVMLIESQSRRVLVQIDGGQIRLPSIRMSRHERAARTLQRCLRDWQVSGAMLDLLSDPSTGRTLVLAESFSTTLPSEMAWFDLDTVPSEWWSEREATRIETLMANSTPSVPGDLGWLCEALSWAEEIAHDHLCSRDGITQWNASYGFTLVRLPMERGNYWLKATGSPSSAELSLTRLVSALRSVHVPTIVGWRDDWNAWLMKEEGTTLSSMSSEPSEIVSQMGKAIQAMAELQVASIGRTDALFAAGAFDQRIPRIREALDGLFHPLAEASRDEAVANGSGNNVAAIRSAVERACERLETVGTPATLVHGDLNLGNLIFTAQGCILLDWAETYVGHPFCSLQHLLLLNPVRDRTVRRTMEFLWIDQYRNILYRAMSPEALEEGFASMPLMAAVAALYGRGDWMVGDETALRRKRSFACSLLPHLDRAAQQFETYAAGATVCVR